MHAQEISFYHAVIIAFLIFGVVCGFFIVSMFRQHKKNIILYKAKVAAEITTLENERRRIANDLHDDLGPLLSAIKFKIGSIDASQEDAQLIIATEKSLDEVVQRLRHISNDLMPATLLRKGFTYAVEEFIEKLGRKSQIQISFQYPQMTGLSDTMNINLYRILLEIIHNALKHSKATILDIIIQIHQSQIAIETKDNGSGFNIAHMVRGSTGRGLSNILNRAELLNGDVYVESAPGKGTSYLITIPYQ